MHGFASGLMAVTWCAAYGHMGCDANEEGLGRGQASQNVWKHIVWAVGALGEGPMIC